MSHNIKKQIEYTKNECIKNFRGPKTPSLKFFMFGIFQYLERQRGPCIKNLGGQGLPGGGGSAWEVSAELLSVYAFLGCHIMLGYC